MCPLCPAAQAVPPRALREVEFSQRIVTGMAGVVSMTATAVFEADSYGLKCLWQRQLKDLLQPAQGCLISRSRTELGASDEDTCWLTLHGLTKKCSQCRESYRYSTGLLTLHTSQRKEARPFYPIVT